MASLATHETLRVSEPDSDSLTHLLHLLRRVQHGADDHNSVQQVQRNPMWGADVLCPSRKQHI